MTRSHKLGFLTAALGASAIAAAICNRATPTRDTPEPIWPTKEWHVSTPEEEGMDPRELSKLVDWGTAHRFDSVLIARHGKIVLEAYYAPYAAGIPHQLFSVTKSVISTLTAIAWKEGLLDSPNRRVLDFLDASNIADLDERKGAITVQNLLDMTSGLEWTEQLGDSVPAIKTDGQMANSPDWVKFILDRPMSSAPGATFNYDSGNTHLLSAILTKLTGMSALEYARAKLFGPLGIKDVYWRQDPQNISIGGYGLWLLPRDMAKIGYLYLRDGVWEGKQLLPSIWIDKINHATIDMQLGAGLRYSNCFWALPEKHVYMAVGYRGQVIMVFPGLNVVAVTTSSHNFSLGEFADTVSGSVKSDMALPADAEGTKLLAEKTNEAMTEKPTGSEIASIISGKVYRFASNKLNLKSLSLVFTGPQPRYEMVYAADEKQPDQTVRGPIGLDGLYRKVDPVVFEGIPLVGAAKGTWQDDHTFVIERRLMGMGQPPEQWTLTFNGNKLNVSFKFADRPEITADGETGE